MQLKVAQISIVCQAYQYVIQIFTGFGILTTGKVFVFLRVDWDEPGVLYFHVSTPDVDVLEARARDEDEDADNGVQVDENTRVRNSLYLTAVGQYLAFALRAYRRSLLPGQEAHRGIYEISLASSSEQTLKVLNSLTNVISRLPSASPGLETTQKLSGWSCAVSLRAVGAGRSPAAPLWGSEVSSEERTNCIIPSTRNCSGSPWACRDRSFSKHFFTGSSILREIKWSTFHSVAIGLFVLPIVASPSIELKPR
ncbi:hypothetical protein E4U13_000768 [Claviceps humidiphila]|uniref:Uncharacterized protein n=1 Tax=Claviceps humidiphila TaxID=1294629 RepID=A0A9P7Q3M7_9HYPO|nr:hypothetical protein E4U13_000768 [Claviceps humidiphila]